MSNRRGFLKNFGLLTVVAATRPEKLAAADLNEDVLAPDDLPECWREVRGTEPSRLWMLPLTARYPLHRRPTMQTQCFPQSFIGEPLTLSDLMGTYGFLKPYGKGHAARCENIVWREDGPGMYTLDMNDPTWTAAGSTDVDAIALIGEGIWPNTPVYVLSVFDRRHVAEGDVLLYRNDGITVTTRADHGDRAEYGICVWP